MSPKSLTVVFGTASFGNTDPFKSDDDLAKVFSVLDKHGVKHLDSAQLYGASETRLGEMKAGDKYILDTKWIGGFMGQKATKDTIVNTGKESIKKLGVDQVDIFYIHAPDKDTPISETLAGVNEVYKLGLFKRFGLSNFLPDHVREVHDHCKSQGYVLPTVYQGNYSPVARHQDTQLFPVLRELGMAFYAYSPLAGGFLTKTKAQIAEGAGRFNKDAIGGLYKNLYVKPSYLEALEKWEKVANETGCSRAELAYRWVTYNSPLKADQGDAIIVGASRPEQLDQTLKGLEAGPLPDSACKAIDEIWESVKAEAPVDNFNG